MTQIQVLKFNFQTEHGLLDELQLVAGCRVMLKYNIDVSDGLVNGATGKVLHIVLLANSVTTILVEFDNQEIGRRAKQESHFKQDYPTAVKRAIPISRSGDADFPYL